MKRISFTLGAAAVSLLCLFGAPAARAQSWRTWVSGVGDDSNTCSRTAPCKTFSGALAKTLEGGEISVLDSADYGHVTINKAVTINGAGALAGINAPPGGGVLVNVTTNPSTATVTLRNLHINGMLTGGGQGIRFLAGKSLVIDHCRIYGFRNGTGIDAWLEAAGNLKVIDSLIEDCAVGFSMRGFTGQLLATIERTRVLNCNVGISAIENVRAQISDSVISHIKNLALATHPLGTDAIFNVDRVAISHSGIALWGVGSGSVIRVSNSTITRNGTGISGNVHSFQGNSLEGNTTNGSFVTTTSKQ